MAELKNLIVNGTARVNGDIYADNLGAAVSYDSGLGKATFSVGEQKFIFNVEEVVKPNAPTINSTELSKTCTTASSTCSVTVKNNTSGATMEYSLDSGSWTSTNGTISGISSGFKADNLSTTSASKSIKVRAKKNGLYSDENNYTLYISRALVAPTLGSWLGDTYSKSRSCDISQGVETGATQEYSIDGGITWTSIPSAGYEHTETVTTVGTIEAEKVQVRTKHSGYTDATVKSSSADIGKQPLYLGCYNCADYQTIQDFVTAFQCSTKPEDVFIPSCFMKIKDNTLKDKTFSFTFPSGLEYYKFVAITKEGINTVNAQIGSMTNMGTGYTLSNQPTWKTENLKVFSITGDTSISISGKITVYN